MRLQYDENFIESTVLLCASRPGARWTPFQIRRFHLARERCYEIADADERNAAFFKVHLAWFREWKIEASLLEVLNEFPLLGETLDMIAFRMARGKSDEAAELYVNENTTRNAIVALQIDRLLRDESLRPFLRHEFMHLHDMLNPEFGYDAFPAFATANPTQQRIARERYRILWDIAIDGRLLRNGRSTAASREDREIQFNQAFPFWSDEKRREVFARHWNDPLPRHQALLAVAADPREAIQSPAPLAGGACPLCQFPTFEWMDGSLLRIETVPRLRAEFPNWTPELGLCRRCAEVYETTDRLELPATIVL